MAPAARAASTWGDRERRRASARTRRAISGQPVRAMRNVAVHAEGAARAEPAATRTRAGKAWTTPVTKRTGRSARAPRAPAAPPRSVPAANARAAAANPTGTETRAPWSRRARTSRPRSSVPSRCSPSGGWRRASRSVASGSNGTGVTSFASAGASVGRSRARRGARIATRGKRARMKRRRLTGRVSLTAPPPRRSAGRRKRRPHHRRVSPRRRRGRRRA